MWQIRDQKHSYLTLYRALINLWKNRMYINVKHRNLTYRSVEKKEIREGCSVWKGFPEDRNGKN